MLHSITTIAALLASLTLIPTPLAAARSQSGLGPNAFPFLGSLGDDAPEFPLTEPSSKNVVSLFTDKKGFYIFMPLV